MQLQIAPPDANDTKPQLNHQDDLYEAAVDIVIREGRGSVSLLQRALGIGYGRAARLIDYMAEDGIVGTYNGSQAREVIITLADWEARQGGGPAAGAAPQKSAPAVAPRRPSNRILLPAAPSGESPTAAAAAKPATRPAVQTPPWDEEEEGEEDAADEDEQEIADGEELVSEAAFEEVAEDDEGEVAEDDDAYDEDDEDASLVDDDEAEEEASNQRTPSVAAAAKSDRKPPSNWSATA